MLTPIKALKLEIGLLGEAESLLSDAEIQYFLDKNNGSVRRASLDAAKTVLFILAQNVREKTALELELYNQQWYEQYANTLKMYIKDPNYSIAINGAMPYAGGISVEDVQANINNLDTISVSVDSGVPIDGEAQVYATKDQLAFSDQPIFRKSPFTI